MATSGALSSRGNGTSDSSTESCPGNGNPIQHQRSTAGSAHLSRSRSAGSAVSAASSSSNGWGRSNQNPQDLWSEYDDVVPCETPPASLRSLQSAANLGNGRVGGVTYAGQIKLPRLPIPSLEDTVRKFRSTLAALQDGRQREETDRVAEEFLAGDGPQLQEWLLEYEREGGEANRIGSYVEEVW